MEGWWKKTYTTWLNHWPWFGTPMHMTMKVMWDTLTDMSCSSAGVLKCLKWMNSSLLMSCQSHPPSRMTERAVCADRRAESEHPKLVLLTKMWDTQFKNWRTELLDSLSHTITMTICYSQIDHQQHSEKSYPYHWLLKHPWGFYHLLQTWLW